MSAWVLIAAVFTSSGSIGPVNLGRYATQADCQRVAAETRKLLGSYARRMVCVQVSETASGVAK